MPTETSLRSKPGTKHVTMEVSFWYQEDDGEIHIVSDGHKSFHTTVNKKEGSKRCHPNLFDKLWVILQSEGKA